jgi:transposase-like protein
MSRRSDKPAVDQPIEELRLSVLTRQHVEAVIREMGPERAWKALGVARTTLYRWMREWKEAGNGK